jgi:hypothetical protein
MGREALIKNYICDSLEPVSTIVDVATNGLSMMAQEVQRDGILS